MSNQLNFDAHFDGSTYEPQRDKARLKGQMLNVYDVMKDGEWRSLQELSISADAPEASVSARLRDLRKTKFGGFDVQRKNVGGGKWKYRIGGMS